ncbi:MAG: Mur ligase family protein [Chloroherpetonaceae bacterium]|nr:Mur ligase family protein [Chloroherpetonaceae bacterium]
MSKHHYYFIGIGGTAMASVASALAKSGETVSGSDSGVYPPMSTFLQSQGIPYHTSYSEEQILNSGASHIVVGNAISRGNPELEAALNLRLPLLSMSEIIKTKLIESHTSLVVTGTHGKTTTTSIAAFLADAVGLNTGFLIGGIPENFGYGARPVPNPNASGVFIIEGDEYDTAFFDKRSKFLHYRPDIAIVNNIEFDHADIFASIEEIELSFRRFINLIPKNGILLVNAADSRAVALAKKSLAPVEQFQVCTDREPLGEAEWEAGEIELDSGETRFHIFFRGESVAKVSSPLAGYHNVSNALAAIAAVYHAGEKKKSVSEIAGRLSHFKSPKRRLEVIADNSRRQITVVDDFAHHPTAIRETLKALAQRFPQRRIVTAFEPRSNTTTRSFFQTELALCFELASVVGIGAVNRPERYSESERLNPKKLEMALNENGKAAYATPIPVPENHIDLLAAFITAQVRDGDVVILLSNGSFDGLGQKVIHQLGLNQ